MAVTYGFYNSVGGDRTYDALQMSSVFDGIVKDGILKSYLNAFTVTVGSGLSVWVDTGRAWFFHTWTLNDAALQLTLNAADPVLPRIDTVILEVDSITRTNRIFILQGTPASDPLPATKTRNSTVMQYNIAEIFVDYNAVSLDAGDITDRRGTPTCPYALGLDSLNALPTICSGRLSLLSGDPLPTTNVTAATTLYFIPYIGKKISLYDSVSWTLYDFVELSFSLSGYVANTNYDVFLWNSYLTSAPVFEFDLVAWTNDTTRAVNLSYQDGILSKSTDTRKRYLGTIRITGTTGQCEDSSSKRYCWNYYNRSPRQLSYQNTSAHSYSTAAWRAFNNVTTPHLSAVVGINTYMWANGSFGTNNSLLLNIGVNGVSSAASKINNVYNAAISLATLSASSYFTISAGLNDIWAIEWGSASGYAESAYIFAKVEG